MAYSTIAEVQPLSVYKDGTGDAGGKITQAIATADLLIKAKIKGAGLTPPSSDDVLKGASQILARGILRRMKREEGSLPVGAGSPDTYDATNKAVDFDHRIAMEMVAEYIKYASEDVQPSDVNGQIRSDYQFKNLKLNQNDIAEPVNIDGDSLADDQRS